MSEDIDKNASARKEQKSCSKTQSSNVSDAERARNYESAMVVFGKTTTESGYIQRIAEFRRQPTVSSCYSRSLDA